MLHVAGTPSAKEFSDRNAYFSELDFLVKYCVVEIREEIEDVDAEDAPEVCRKGERPREADGGVMNEGVMLVEWMRCIARARTSDADDTFPPTTPADTQSCNTLLPNSTPLFFYIYISCFHRFI